MWNIGLTQKIRTSTSVLQRHIASRTRHPTTSLLNSPTVKLDYTIFKLKHQQLSSNFNLHVGKTCLNWKKQWRGRWDLNPKDQDGHQISSKSYHTYETKWKIAHASRQLYTALQMQISNNGAKNQQNIWNQMGAVAFSVCKMLLSC